MRKSTSRSHAKARDPATKRASGLVAPAQVRRLAHPAGAGRKLGTLRLTIRMRRECRKRSGQMRLPAARAGNRVSVAAHQFLELVSAVVTDIFVNRHFSMAPENGVSSILSHRLRAALTQARSCTTSRVCPRHARHRACCRWACRSQPACPARTSHARTPNILRSRRERVRRQKLP